MTGTEEQNDITHVALVLDASSSMTYVGSKLVQVADGLIAHLARRSQELDQETRVSVYTFSWADNIRCAIYDRDVLRLSTLAKHYQVGGNTALCKATLEALNDLAMTPEKHGRHSFLMYVLTDGEENASSAQDRRDLPQALAALPDHWTVACMVPDTQGVQEAKRFGFPPGNIDKWDATSARGVEEAVRRIQTTADHFMTQRSQSGGTFRGTRSLFSTGADVVNATTVKSALVPLDTSAYVLTHVAERTRIDDWVNISMGLRYQVGRGYYELVKSEKIQPQKKIMVLEKSTQKVYHGPAARQILGLPDMEVRVKPDANKEYTILVQSTSVNRILPEHTKLLYLTKDV